MDAHTPAMLCSRLVSAGPGGLGSVESCQEATLCVRKSDPLLIHDLSIFRDAVTGASPCASKSGLSRLGLELTTWAL